MVIGGVGPAEKRERESLCFFARLHHKTFIGGFVLVFALVGGRAYGLMMDRTGDGSGCGACMRCIHRGGVKTQAGHMRRDRDRGPRMYMPC